MNRFFLAGSVAALSLFIIATTAFAASTQDGGGLDNYVGSAVLVSSGGGSSGTGQWVEQVTSSTFSGTISSFSVLATAEAYTGSPTPFIGELWNNQNSDYGIAYVSYANVCDNNYYDISLSPPECVVTFNLDTPVTVSPGDDISMKLQTNHQTGSNYTYYHAIMQNRTPDWILSRIHLINSGSGLTIDWDTNGGILADHQFAWAWNYATTSDPEACTEDCNSNILFLPGIQGSRLYDESEKLWEPWNNGDVEDLYINANGSSSRSDIYTKDIIDEVPLSGLNIYKSFLNDLESWKNEEDLIEDYAAVPYDWRLSLEDIIDYGNRLSNGNIYYSGTLRATTTPYIIEQLQALASSSRTGKVTIVAHSNGGLVAKALMKRLEDLNSPLLSQIDNLILIATPQTGTPQAIGAALHGYRLALPFDNFPTLGLIVSPETGREFASSSPMTYHLFPSDAYFSGGGGGVTTPPITFIAGSATQPFIDAYGYQTTSSNALYRFLSGFEERPQADRDDLINPLILSKNLIAYATSVHSELDNWIPPTSTQVYQVAGWGIETLSSIEYETGYECSSQSGGVCTEWGPGPGLQYTPQIVVDGDGIVPTASALAMSTSTANITRLWLNLRDYNASFFVDRDHKNILEVGGLRTFIKENIITHSTTSIPEFLSSDQPIPDEEDSRLHFYLHSPLRLSAYDSEGREVSETTSTIPHGYFERFGEVQYISLPKESRPKISLNGFAAGSFTLNVHEFTGSKVTASTTFAGVPCVTSTRAFMNFSDGTIIHASPLTTDFDGEGRPDFSLNPKLNTRVPPLINKTSSDSY